jgi:hypothetical protein
MLSRCRGKNADVMRKILSDQSLTEVGVFLSFDLRTIVSGISCSRLAAWYVKGLVETQVATSYGLRTISPL